MQQIQVLDKQFVSFLSAELIQQKIEEIAGAINTDFATKKPLFIAVLNGSFMFAADLFKKLSIPAEICFIKLASYKGTKSTGQVVTAIGLDIDIIDRHVILLEDIVDTGRTLGAFIPQLVNQQPASLSLAVLLHKPEATVIPVNINYLGFSIPDKFVVGFGLDYDGYGRNLKAIYQLAE
jgi:hypoxanthine phosphoribosyltransferase